LLLLICSLGKGPQLMSRSLGASCLQQTACPELEAQPSSCHPLVPIYPSPPMGKESGGLETEWGPQSTEGTKAPLEVQRVGDICFDQNAFLGKDCFVWKVGMIWFRTLCGWV
jgi:hypothetical protein